MVGLEVVKACRVVAELIIEEVMLDKWLDSPKEDVPHPPRPGPKEDVPHPPRPADDDAWRGWKPRDMLRMPPKGRVSAEKQQSNCSPSLVQVTCQPQPPPRGIDHEEFCKDLNGMSLPRDHEERANFDQQDVFILGDPAASFDRSCGHNYDCKSDNPHAGFPVWKKIFSYILRDCGYLVDYDTVYVMVDTRNLADHAARDPGLPHWQAAVAWWESRLQCNRQAAAIQQEEMLAWKWGSKGSKDKGTSPCGMYIV